MDTNYNKEFSKYTKNYPNSGVSPRTTGGASGTIISLWTDTCGVLPSIIIKNWHCYTKAFHHLLIRRKSCNFVRSLEWDAQTLPSDLPAPLQKRGHTEQKKTSPTPPREGTYRAKEDLPDPLQRRGHTEQKKTSPHPSKGGDIKLHKNTHKVRTYASAKIRTKCKNTR